MNYRHISTRILTSILPKLGILQLIYKNTRDNQLKKLFNMKLSVKILIGSGVTLFIIVVFGFIAFPKFLMSQIKKVSE